MIAMLVVMVVVVVVRCCTFFKKARRDDVDDEEDEKLLLVIISSHDDHAKRTMRVGIGGSMILDCRKRKGVDDETELGQEGHVREGSYLS